MKKNLALILTVCMLAVVGCSGAASSPAQTSQEEPSSSAADSTSQSDSSSASAEATPTALFDEIKALEIGTAGSSLKAAIVAAHLMDWREDSTLSDADFCAALTQYIDALEDADREQFVEQLTSATDTARYLLTDAGAADLLESAGNPQTHDSYTAEKQQSLLDALSALEQPAEAESGSASQQ